MFGKSKKIKELEKLVKDLELKNASIIRDSELEKSRLKSHIDELEMKNTRALVQLGKCRGFKRDDKNYQKMIVDQRKYISKLIAIKNDYKNELKRMKIIDKHFGSRVSKYVEAIEVRRTTHKSYRALAQEYEIGNDKLGAVYKSIQNDERLKNIFKLS